MNTRQTLLGGVGVLCLALGASVRDVSVSAAPVESGGDYLLIALLAGTALLAAIAVLASGRTRNLRQTETPDPETPVQYPHPGREFDESVRRWGFRTPVGSADATDVIEDRLRTAAVKATMHAENCGRTRARRAVERGEWTDDGVAAAFLDPSRGRTVTAVLAALVRFQLPAEFRARRTADAVYDLARSDTQ
ncbi:DUF7269 family protein [Halobellus rufus]|uniref:DUF7269 family protein n=1 Tax=Halobellus rufus TaxID=1448860 RepID=UPI0006794259|nr:hypothetical protein [Halobellus rufus]